MLLAIRFKVEGSLMFLSHAETLKVFQRACVRARIRVRYSEGFNPRPKLSLPLPRPVGVESDDELLCVRLERDPAAGDAPGETEADWESRIKDALDAQLPEGCELLSVSQARVGASFQPRSATYVVPVQPEYFNDELRATVERVLASESLPLRRPIDKNGLKFKNVDVRGFLKSIKTADGRIIAECEIRPDGSVRVDELLKLLGLDERMLASPVRRTNVQWQSN
ncbi:MAG: TIGR03936 family radical SAM-associated protein [Planctomycetota bacterium]|jgi:radical SAM-linked protein